MPQAHLPVPPWYRRARVPMFGLGNRKVLKYSAIETSLSIDVEDTVTCFCRSVSACLAPTWRLTSDPYTYMTMCVGDAGSNGTSDSVSSLSFSWDLIGIVYQVYWEFWYTFIYRWYTIISMAKIDCIANFRSFLLLISVVYYILHFG